MDVREKTRRVLDLFVVSVLLDAVAGIRWRYRTKATGKSYGRSEGLAVASLEMFKSGLFSSDAKNPHQVDSNGLKSLTVSLVADGLQVSADNPIDGLHGRIRLLVQLGAAMDNAEFFGVNGRPGNMLGKYPAWIMLGLSLIHI